MAAKRKCKKCIHGEPHNGHKGYCDCTLNPIWQRLPDSHYCSQFEKKATKKKTKKDA